jgi:hypothetical protein
VDLASSLVVIVRCPHRRKVGFLGNLARLCRCCLMAASVTVQPKLPLRTVTIVEDHHAKKTFLGGGFVVAELKPVRSHLLRLLR